MSDEEEDFGLSETSESGDFSVSEEDYEPEKDGDDYSDSDAEVESSENSEQSDSSYADDDERVPRNNKKRQPTKNTKTKKRASLSSSFRHSTVNKYRQAGKSFANNPNVSTNLREILQRSQFTKKKVLSQNSQSQEENVAPNFDCNAGLRLSDSESDEEDSNNVSVSIKSLAKPTEKPEVIASTSSAAEASSSQLNMAKIMENLRETEKVQEQLKSIQGKSLEPRKNIDDLNVSQLLALGETSKKRSQNAMSESDSEWEDVEDNQEKEEPKIQIPLQGIEITISASGDKKKEAKEVDVEMQMRRQFNRQRKEFQVYLHKTNLMMWIGHGNYVNPILNNTSLMQQCLALLPKNNNHCYPKEKTDTKYFKQISEWFKSQISLNNREMYCKLQKRPPLLTSLALQIKTKQAICRRDFVLIFIILLRAIGIQCRMVLNLNFAPLRPPQSDLLSLSTKEQSKKKDKDDEGSISKYKKYSSSGSSKNSKDSKSTSKSSKDSSNSASKSNSKPKMKSQSNKENIADQPSFISPKIASRTRSKSRQNLEAIPQMDGVDDIPKKPTKSLRIKALKEFDVSIDQSYVKLSPDENPAKASTSGREPVASKRTKKVEAPSSAKKMRSRSKSGTRKEAPAKSDSFKENSTPGKSSEKVAIPKLANLRNMARKSVHFSASTEEREINGQNPESAEKPKEKIAVEETEKPKEKSKVPEKSSKIEKPLESDESSKKSSKFSKLKQYKKSEPEKSMSPEKPKESTKSEKPGSSRKTVEKKSDDSKSEKPGSSRKKVEKKSEDSKVEKPGSSRKKVEKKSDDSKAERPSSSRKPSERLEKKKEPEKSTSSEKKAQKRSTSSAQKEVEAKKRKANSKSKPKVLEIEYMDDSGSSDEEYDKAQKAKAKKTVKNDHRDRRVLSTDLDESIDASDKQGKSKKMGIDIWVELYSEADEKWIPVDVFKGKVGAVPEICKAASHPITYVLAWNNDNSVKDVSAKYCSNFNTTTRKLRVEPSYLESILKHFKGRVTARDRKEDDEIAQQMADQELPTSVQDYKNHPLYALKRHLLKFEAIYPPDVPTLGFIREEPIYPRDAVFTLHSREIWVKQAKVVKPFEQPYKIVTARPKWDRATKSVIKDIPLELFGVWQTQEYEPPTAENGVVPRNAYGNVELFKPTMLPKKTVHIQLPGLNKVCKKLNIDCAQAVVGFDFHGGSSHPVFDGFVVCEEFAEKVVDAWNREQDEMEQREEQKREKRVMDNWKKLIRGLLIRERLKIKYNF